MLFKIVLIIALVAQVVAAILALRLNLRYRIYSAWLFLSAAAFGMAILRFLSLYDIWGQDLTITESLVVWTTSIASLMVSMFFVAGMALIEPFFQTIAHSQESLVREHRQLQNAMRTTEEELSLARRVQQNLLPKSAPTIPGIEVAGGSVPAEWTGGDYYDYVPLENGATGFIIADVSGHGLGPAILMSSTRASVRALCKRFDNLATVLREANLAVNEAVAGGGFVTAFALRLDDLGNEFHYAAAGHIAYLFRSEGSPELLSGNSPPLGVVPDLQVRSSGPWQLEHGDVIALVTDGIVETKDPHGNMFGDQRLVQIVQQHRTEDAESIVTAIFDATRQFRRIVPQADDVTAVIIKKQ